MTKKVRYPNRAKEFFHSRGGHGFTLVRGLSLKLKLKRPGDKPVDTPPVETPIIKEPLVTNSYIIGSSGGLFTLFRFGDVNLNAVNFIQVAEHLSNNQTLKDKGFVFEASADSIVITATKENETIEEFSWIFSKQATVIEATGKAPEYTNNKTYSEVTFTSVNATVEEIPPTVPVTPIPDQPLPTPVIDPVRTSLITEDLIIYLDSGDTLDTVEIGTVYLENEVTLPRVKEALAANYPNLLVEEINSGNGLIIKVGQTTEFSNVRLIPSPESEVVIRETLDSEPKTYIRPGVIYETLKLVNVDTVEPEQPPVTEEPTKEIVIRIGDEEDKVSIAEIIANGGIYPLHDTLLVVKLINGNNAISVEQTRQYEDDVVGNTTAEVIFLVDGTPVEYSGTQYFAFNLLNGITTVSTDFAPAEALTLILSKVVKAEELPHNYLFKIDEDYFLLPVGYNVVKIGELEEFLNKHQLTYLDQNDGIIISVLETDEHVVVNLEIAEIVGTDVNNPTYVVDSVTTFYLNTSNNGELKLQPLSDLNVLRYLISVDYLVTPEVTPVPEVPAEPDDGGDNNSGEPEVTEPTPPDETTEPVDGGEEEEVPPAVDEPVVEPSNPDTGNEEEQPSPSEPSEPTEPPSEVEEPEVGTPETPDEPDTEDPEVPPTTEEQPPVVEPSNPDEGEVVTPVEPTEPSEPSEPVPPEEVEPEQPVPSEPEVEIPENPSEPDEGTEEPVETPPTKEEPVDPEPEAPVEPSVPDEGSEETPVEPTEPDTPKEPSEPVEENPQPEVPPTEETPDPEQPVEPEEPIDSEVPTEPDQGNPDETNPETDAPNVPDDETPPKEAPTEPVETPVQPPDNSGSETEQPQPSEPSNPVEENPSPNEPDNGEEEPTIPPTEEPSEPVVEPTEPNEGEVETPPTDGNPDNGGETEEQPPVEPEVPDEPETTPPAEENPETPVVENPPSNNNGNDNNTESGIGFTAYPNGGYADAYLDVENINNIVEGMLDSGGMLKYKYLPETKQLEVTQVQPYYSSMALDFPKDTVSLEFVVDSNVKDGEKVVHTFERLRTPALFNINDIINNNGELEFNLYTLLDYGDGNIGGEIEETPIPEQPPVPPVDNTLYFQLSISGISHTKVPASKFTELTEYDNTGIMLKYVEGEDNITVRQIKAYDLQKNDDADWLPMVINVYRGDTLLNTDGYVEEDSSEVNIIQQEITLPLWSTNTVTNAVRIVTINWKPAENEEVDRFWIGRMVTVVPEEGPTRRYISPQDWSLTHNINLWDEFNEKEKESNLYSDINSGSIYAPDNNYSESKSFIGTVTYGFIDGRFPFNELTYRGSPEIRTVNWTENNKYQFLTTTPSSTQDENGPVWNHKVIVFNRDSYFHDTDVSNPPLVVDENTLYIQLELAGNLYNKVPLSEFVGGEFKQYDNSVVGLKYDETTHVLDIIQNAPLKVDAIQYGTSNSKVHVYRGSAQLNSVDSVLDDSVDLDIVNRTHNFDLDKTFDEQVTYVFGVTQYTDENETIGRRLIISPVGETTRTYIVPNSTTDKDYVDSVNAVMLQELSDFTWAGNALLPKINWKGVLEFGAIKADTDFDNVVWVYPLVETTVTSEALRDAVANNISALSIDHEDTNTKRYVFDVDVHDAETDTEPQLDDLWWNIKIDDDLYTFNNGTRLNNRFVEAYPVLNTATTVSNHLQYKYGLMVDIGDDPLRDIDVYFDPANSSEPIEHIIEIYLTRGDIKERAVKFSDKQLEHQLNAANIYTGVALNVDEFTGGTTHVIYVDSSSNESIPDGGEQEAPSGVKVWVQIASDYMPFAIPLTENSNNELKAALTPYGIDVQDVNGSLRINHLPEAQFGTVPDSLTLVVSEASTYEEALTMIFNSFNYYCTMREPAQYANIQGLNIFTKHHIVIDYFNPNFDVVFKSDTYPGELVIPYTEFNPYEPNERVTQWFAERGYVYNQGTNPETHESGMSFSLKDDNGEVQHFMNKIRVFYQDRTNPDRTIGVDPISGVSYWNTSENNNHVSVIATPHTPVTVNVNMAETWE